jgi:sialate O-acetylesterase
MARISIRPLLGAGAAVFTVAGVAPAQAADFDPMFQDHAVLQRERPIEVWGQAVAGERLSVEIAGHAAQAKAGSDGHWRARLDALPAGGPYELKLTGAKGEVRTVSDVMVGDVWLCSGQSNMEFPVRRGLDYETEIAASDNPNIRLLMIPRISHAQATGPSRCRSNGRSRRRTTSRISPPPAISLAANCNATRRRRSA